MNLDELHYNTKLYNLKSFVWNHRNQATIFISSLNDTLEMREISLYIYYSFNSFCCNVDVTFILAYPSPRADMIPSTFFFEAQNLLQHFEGVVNRGILGASKQWEIDQQNSFHHGEISPIFYTHTHIIICYTWFIYTWVSSHPRKPSMLEAGALVVMIQVMLLSWWW